MRIKVISSDINLLLDSIKEIEYEIATARSKGERVVKFSFENENEKILKRIKSKLASLKKEGRIQYIIWKESFEKRDTLSEYAIDRIPDIQDNLKEDSLFLFVLL